MDARKLIAEAIGSYILVGLGSLAIVGAVATSAPILAVVPFGFGLGLLAAIAVAGHVSGGHFNPAVTVGAVLDRRTDPLTGVGYIVAQILGALAASATLLVVGPGGRDDVARTLTHPGSGVTDVGAFAVEVVLTAILVAVILTITRRAADQAVFVIPLTFAVVYVAGIPLSGASVNPARSLGPAIVAGDLSALWIYLTAPFVGAVLGWIVFRILADD